MTAAPEAGSAPGLMAVTVAALQGAGRLVASDWEAETFDVSIPDASPIAGVILHASNSVAFYAVWDAYIPDGARAAVAQWSVAANTELTTSALEFNSDNGILSARAVVHLAEVAIGAPGSPIGGEEVAISRAAFAGLLTAAVDDVAATRTRLEPAVAGLCGR